MALAAIPEAVLVHASKNFGYVSIGAFGLIASFVAGIYARPGWLLERSRYRALAWIVCVLLILVHGPVALAKRIVAVKAGSVAFAWARRSADDRSDIANKNVVIVNNPLPLESYYAPSYAAYYHWPLPKTLHVLTLACTGFVVQRTDDKTLVLQSVGSNIFSCDDVGSVHPVYALSAFNGLLSSETHYKTNERIALIGIVVEILDVDTSDLPSRVASNFDISLDSPDYRWFWFDWRTHSTDPFKVPSVGQRVTLPGP